MTENFQSMDKQLASIEERLQKIEGNKTKDSEKEMLHLFTVGDMKVAFQTENFQSMEKVKKTLYFHVFYIKHTILLRYSGKRTNTLIEQTAC